MNYSPSDFFEILRLLKEIPPKYSQSVLAATGMHGL